MSDGWCHCGMPTNDPTHDGWCKLLSWNRTIFEQLREQREATFEEELGHRRYLNERR